MNLRIRKARLLMTAAVAVVGGVAAVLPASPAAAYFNPPLFLDVAPQSPSHIVASGAAVDVAIQFIAAGATLPGTLQVTVTEQVNGLTATGTTSIVIQPAPQRQTALVRVRATLPGVAFAPGPALIDAGVFGCAAALCGEEHQSTDVSINP